MKPTVDRPVIEANNLSKTYPGATTPAVAQLSFRLEPGEILALLGPNGAGKTTTVKMVAGLITPTSGSVRVLGFDMATQREKGVRHLGAVLEGARNLYWRLSALENLRYFGRLRLVSRSDLARRSADLLARFGLTSHQHQPVGQFSRGMQQKLAIATALLHDPTLLLLDEPTLGLDVPAAKQVEAQVADLAKEAGKGILLTTHQLDLAERLADRVLVIQEGQPVAYDTTTGILATYGDQRTVVELQVAGDLPAEVLAGFELVVASEGETTRLTFSPSDPAQLIDLLTRLNQHQIPVRQLNQRQATLEEVFLSLTQRGAG